MPLLAGPLLSIDATGKFASDYVFQGTIRGPTFKRLGGPRPPPTADQQIQRNRVAGAVASWKIARSTSLFTTQWTSLLSPVRPPATLYSSFQQTAIRLTSRTNATGFGYQLLPWWLGGLRILAIDLVTAGTPNDTNPTDIYVGDTPTTMTFLGTVNLYQSDIRIPYVQTPGTTKYVKLMRGGYPASGLAQITFPNEPTELFLNPGFLADTNWAYTSYWAIPGGYAWFMSSFSRTGLIWQSHIGVVTGQTYTTKFTVTHRGPGTTYTFRLRGTVGTARNAVGTFTEDLVAGSESESGIYATSSTNGTDRIDDASLKDWTTPPP